MALIQSKRDEIAAFEKAYDYDCSYLYDLLERSPAAYDAFAAARPMTSFHGNLPDDAYYVAAISVMQIEDCGTCLQLNIKMALESGVSRDLLRTLLQTPDELPDPLGDIRRHALAVAGGDPVDSECAKRIEQHYGKPAFAELALCVAGVALYPRLTRALLKESECSIQAVELWP